MRERDHAPAFLRFSRHKERVGWLDPVFHHIAQQNASAKHTQSLDLRHAVRQQITALPDLTDSAVGRNAEALGEKRVRALLRLVLILIMPPSRCVLNRRVNALSALSQPCGKMSFAAVHRKDSARQGQIESVASVKARSSEVHAARFKAECRMTVQKRGDNILVLPEGEGAGGIDQHAAFPQTFRGAVQDRQLTHRAGSGMLGRPFRHRLRVSAEHTLPGAGSVHQHAVKKAVHPFGKSVRMGIGHNAVPDAHPLEIRKENLRTLSDILVAPQQTSAVQHRGNLGGFAAGRGTHIQHPFPRLRIKNRHRGHRGRLLRIDGARMVPRGTSNAHLVCVEIESRTGKRTFCNRQS